MTLTPTPKPPCGFCGCNSESVERRPLEIDGKFYGYECVDFKDCNSRNEEKDFQHKNRQ
jgi:hypothetical protein